MVNILLILFGVSDIHSKNNYLKVLKRIYFIYSIPILVFINNLPENILDFFGAKDINDVGTGKKIFMHTFVNFASIIFWLIVYGVISELIFKVNG